MSDLPLDALAAWCGAHVRGFRGPVTATKFKGGQSNPTYRLAAESGTYVLRRKPFGQLLPGAHAVDREFRVLSALHGHGVPVAEPLALCMDEAVIGAMFYVMAHVDGRIFWTPDLPEVPKEVKEARWHRFMQRQQKVSAAQLKKRVGKRLPVIIDEANGTSAKGRTRYDAPEIDGNVHFSSRRPLKVGEIANVKIERADAYDLHGVAV